MQKNRRKDLGKLRKQAINSCNRKQFLTVPKWVNLDLSESLGQELRFAKRINSNGATKLKLRTKEVQI